MDVRAEILHVATRLFAARGFEGTSLQAIAEKVGIRKPSLLYHFRSKEELRLRVFEQVVEHWNARLPVLVTAVMSGEDRFEAVTRELFDFFGADADRARLILRELMDRPEALGPGVAEFVQPWVKLLGDTIRKGQRTGEIFPDVDADAYVVEIMLLVLSVVSTHGVVENALPGAPKAAASKRRLRDEVLRLAKSGLFARSATATRSE